MYALSIVEQLDNRLFLCVKYQNNYRYYGIVYSFPEGHVISLIDKNQNILEHFRLPNTKTAEQALLDICKEYDEFWYPELFSLTSHSFPVS